MAVWSIVVVWAAKCGVMCIDKAGEGNEEKRKIFFFKNKSKKIIF